MSGVESLVTQVQQDGEKKKPLKKPSLGLPGLSINMQKVKEATPRADDEEDGDHPARSLINSPRIERSQWGDEPRLSVPYKDDALLPPLTARMAGRKCLVLDLDETLVHSSFKPVERSDFVVPVEIEGRWHRVYVAKRPYVDEFMKRMGELFEVVVFTASLSKYADPVLDLLDIHKVVDYRLFRESCSCYKGSYVKDMGRMGRPIQYAFNPENAIPCESWFNDYEDTELLDLIPVMEALARPELEDVMAALSEMKISVPAPPPHEPEADSYSSDEEAESTDTKDRDEESETREEGGGSSESHATSS